MRYLVISCSLNKKSRSRRLAELAYETLRASGQEVDWLDLAEHPLPLCDGGEAYGDPRLPPVAAKIKSADGLLLSGPIYNYDFNAAAKNLIELTGASCWAGKVVGFLAAAGGAGSYLSVLPLANSLMTDFRCVIIPRFVYADRTLFGPDGELQDEGVRERVVRIAGDLVAFSRGLEEALRTERQGS